MDYISKEVVLDTIRGIVGDDAFGGPRIQQAIEKMPDCHTVNITRCEECRYLEEWAGVYGTSLFCTFWDTDVPADGYCHQGC